VKRRSFLGILAGAIASTALPKKTVTQPALAPHVANDVGDYRGIAVNSYAQPPKGLPMHVMGDGCGKLWILDPTCPPDQIFGFSPRDFGYQGDAKMYEAFARLEFEQVKYWPRSARITGINAERSDAL